MYRLNEHAQQVAPAYIKYVAQCLYITNTSPVGMDDFARDILPTYRDVIHPVAGHVVIRQSSRPMPTAAPIPLVQVMAGGSYFTALKKQRYGGEVPTTIVQHVPITYNGETKPLGAWALELGIGMEAMVRRYYTDPENMAKLMRPKGAHASKQ